MKRKSLLLAALIVCYAGCASFPDAQTTATRAEQMVSEAHKLGGETLTRRAIQDESQKACSSAHGGTLPQEQAAAVVKAARDSMRYPASGKLSGDWTIGERLVTDGRGQRIVNGKVEPLKENGALCTNCHAMDAQEVNSGNLGPTLVGYGKQRGNSEAVVRYTYERIYNAWAFLPCSNMPRLGASGFLTLEQIAHVVAYLTDPHSPVNR